MPTVADTAKLLKIKKELEAMTPANQLRVAAGLIEQGDYSIAETIAGNIVDELRALRLLRGISERK